MNTENRIVSNNMLFTSFNDEDINHPGIYNLISNYENQKNIASILIKIEEGEFIMNKLLEINY